MDEQIKIDAIRGMCEEIVEMIEKRREAMTDIVTHIEEVEASITHHNKFIAYMQTTLEKEMKRAVDARKKIKDPNEPKRPLSAFFWFCNNERTNIIAQNPEYGPHDIAKELGKMWTSLESTEPIKYLDMAAKDMKRYEVEMIEYKRKCMDIQKEKDGHDDDKGDDEQQNNPPQFTRNDIEALQQLVLTLGNRKQHLLIAKQMATVEYNRARKAYLALPNMIPADIQHLPELH